MDQTLKASSWGQSLTDANCHGDICPSNICLCGNCSYQDYLSCYWPDFDQTLKICSVLGTILNKYQLSRWHMSKQHMSWWHLSISAISQLLLTRFGPNFKGKFLGQSSRWRLSKQHVSWGYLFLSAISKLLLPRFWPKFLDPT